jgi:deoxycytidine triphosphate deaminase
MKRSELIKILMSVLPDQDPCIHICGYDVELITHSSFVGMERFDYIDIDNTYADKGFAFWCEEKKMYVLNDGENVLYPTGTVEERES